MVFCFVVGTKVESSFQVGGQAEMSISDLRELIYEKRKSKFENKGFDPSDLHLWKVNIPGDEENDKFVKLRTLENRSHNEDTIIQELEGQKLTPFDDFGDIFAYSDLKKIRIIVQPPLPATTAKGKKDKRRYPDESEEGRDSLMVISSKRVKWITEFVENNHISLLRSPPSSGKSTLGQVLRDYFESLNYDSIYISLAGINGKQEIYDEELFENFWKKKVGRTWTEISECKKDTYVFIDEIQTIYGNRAPFFWGIVKDLLSSESSLQNIRIILLGTYHPTLDPQMTPVEIRHTLGLDALLLTWEEVHQLIMFYIQRHATLGSPSFNIPGPVQKAIFNLTGGYPGLCRFILTALRNQFRENGKTVEMLRYLASSYLRDGIISTARAFHWIRDWNITDEESEFIRKKLLHQIGIPFSADYASNPVTNKFVKMGLFSTFDSDERIQFSAPITRVILSHYLFTAPVNFKSLPARTFDEFLVRTIERMSPSKLSESIGKGYGDNSHLYERSWQMEWYRTATTVVPEGTSISADVGAVFGSVGFLDFYVNGKLCWGIELTREGNSLKEHAERFEQGGKYADIPLKDWAIIDFRHHTKQVRELKQNFWYVLYDDNYKRVIIKRRDQDDKVLVLHGD